MTASRFNLRAYVKKYNKIYRVCELHTDNEYLTVQICDNDNTVVFDKDKKINPTLFSKNEIELMQSTGFVDKNGKEIYEGDILKDKNELIVVQYNTKFNLKTINLIEKLKEITIEDNSDDLGMINLNFFTCKDYIENEIEIIGNIYENKELLKK